MIHIAVDMVNGVVEEMEEKPAIKFDKVNAGEVYFHKCCGLVIIGEDFDDRYCKGAQAVKSGDGYIASSGYVWVAKSQLEWKQQ